MPLTQDTDVRELLKQTKTVAVVGWSNKPDRPSHNIAAALQRSGYEVYFVNPTVKSTDEYTVYPSLADVPVKIDVVDVFRRSEDVPEVVDDAIAVGAKAVWMQLGISNAEAAQRAEEAGLRVVMNKCMKVEHFRLMS